MNGDLEMLTIKIRLKLRAFFTLRMKERKARKENMDRLLERMDESMRGYD